MTVRNPPIRFLHRSRRAAVLAAVLVAATLATVVLAAAVRSALTVRRQIGAYQREVQAPWLVHSAVDRAAAELHRDGDYAGETWTVPAAELGGADAAVVTIRVEPVADDANGRLVRVRADLPAAGVRRVRKSGAVVVELEL